MPTLAAWLMANIGAFGTQLLLSLGFSWLTYSSVDTGLGLLTSYAQQYWSGLPADVLQLASLAGVPQGLGIIFGAMSGRVGLWLAGNAKKLVTKK